MTFLRVIAMAMFGELEVKNAMRKDKRGMGGCGLSIFTQVTCTASYTATWSCLFFSCFLFLSSSGVSLKMKIDILSTFASLRGKKHLVSGGSRWARPWMEQGSRVVQSQLR